jgi:hypothetical protein
VATLPPIPSSEPPFSLGKIFAGLVLVAASFDYCFWGAKGLGFSAAVFALVLAGAILLNRETRAFRRSTAVIIALLAGSCVEATIETGVTNTLVGLILVLALAGDSFFDKDRRPWARWFSQGVAMAFAPGRVFWLCARMVEAGFTGGTPRGQGAVRVVVLAIPALVLAVVFGGLLASGNAVFGSWTASAFTWLDNALANLLDIERIACWLLVAFVVLPLLRPGRVADWWWSWITRIERLPELVAAPGAALSSAMILVVLNAIFAVANVADAIFLWSGNKLPAGVTYSGYVHNGVDTLTFTVLLSAIVLASIFQQQLSVAGRRGLKALGLLWIAQNVFVLVSVMLRLKLYIQAYDMTVERLSVILFLLLVAAGFGLLAIQIVREKSLPWLVGGCAGAIFATLYLAQFLNLAGWSADYNVAQWEKDKTRNLDTAYLYSLGPAAWPALRTVHGEEPSVHVLNASSDDRRGPDTSGDDTLALFDGKHWREFSLRAWWNRAALDEGE